MKNYTKLIIFLVVLFVGFGIAILALSWPYLTGKTYILATNYPVDPFDIVKGQYSIINYEINTLNNTANIAQEDIGRNIYVSLGEDNQGVWHPVAISLTKPSQGDFIKGTIENVFNKRIQATYGIEEYYLERGASFSSTNITVEVKISSSGKARISRLLKDNKPLEIEYG